MATLTAVLLTTEGGVALVAVAVNTHSDVLVNTLGLRSYIGEVPFRRVDVKTMLLEESLCPVGRRKGLRLGWDGARRLPCLPLSNNIGVLGSGRLAVESSVRSHSASWMVH